MFSHPGYQSVSNWDGALEINDGEAIVKAIRTHHEYFSGGGYPDGLAGEHIPVTARIIALADSYEGSDTRMEPCLVSVLAKMIEHG